MYRSRNIPEVEKAIRTLEPKDKMLPIMPKVPEEHPFIAYQGTKLEEIAKRVEKIEAVVANVDVNQFSSIMHSLEQLQKAIRYLQ